jgi:penicillin-insensitive murein endopeptidase
MRPSFHRAPRIVAVSLVSLATAGAHGAGAWPAATAPTPGPARVIGHAGAACLSGGVALPLEGAGYQAMDVSRDRYYGHPSLVGFVTDLGRAVAARGLGTMQVSDLAQPRGGPMTSGHVSHQGGLDVDIWFRMDLPPVPAAAREGLPQPSVVDPATGLPDPARWTDGTAELVHVAALDPRVSRIFVGAALKRDLCQRPFADRAWLRVVRPWPRHDDHMHVRLRCPPGSPACVDQEALPPGDGCGAAELEPAFARERAALHRPPPEPSRVVSPACQALLGPPPGSHFPDRVGVSRLSAHHAKLRAANRADRAGRAGVVSDAGPPSRERRGRR